MLEFNFDGIQNAIVTEDSNRCGYPDHQHPGPFVSLLAFIHLHFGDIIIEFLKNVRSKKRVCEDVLRHLTTAH